MRFNLKELLKTIRKSYWIKSGALVLTTRVSLMALGFISFLILIRYLDKEHYGIWVIFMTITSLIETIRIGFLKSPLMILSADKSIEKDKLYSSVFYLNLAFSLILALLISVSVSLWHVLFDNELVRNLFYLYIVKLIIISFGDHLDLVQETNFDFRGTFQDLIARNFIFVSLIVVYRVFDLDFTLEDLVLFQITGSLFGAFFSFVNAYLKRISVFETFHFTQSYSRRFLQLGKFTFGSSLISITIRNVDTWMLGILVSPAAVAIYNPALRLSNVFEIPSSSMSNILLPKLAKDISNEGTKSIGYYYEKSLTYVLMFIIPIIIVFILFSNEIILLIAGKGFDQSGELLKITMFYGLLIPFNRQFTIIMEALGKPKSSFLVMVVTLVLSFILNYLFISIYGIFGAAYGSLLTYFIIFVFTQTYLYQQFDTRIWKIFKGIVPGYFIVFNRFKKFVNDL